MWSGEKAKKNDEGLQVHVPCHNDANIALQSMHSCTYLVALPDGKSIIVVH